MTDLDHDLGRIEAQVEEMQKDITGMQEDLAQMREDIHDMKVILAQMQVKLETNGTDPRLTIFGFLVFMAAGLALYEHAITEWSALALVFIAAVILQKESINKLARIIFRVKDDASRASSANVAPPSV